MINAHLNPPESTSLREERQSITNAWVSAQVKANLWAGIGVAMQITVPVCVVGAVADVLGYLEWTTNSYVAAAVGSLALGMAYAGHLIMVRFSIDEWVASAERKEIIEENQKLHKKTYAYESLVDDMAKLRRENDELRFRLNATGKKSNTVSAPPKITVGEVDETPQIIRDALLIVREWFHDPDPTHPLVSRDALEQKRISADRQREAWILLNSLGIAGREDERPNAKRVLLVNDEHEIRERINRYLANTSREDNSYVAAG